MSKNTDIIDLINYVRAGHSDEKICRYFGGSKIYVPMTVPNVEEKIQAEFNGHNFRQLRHKYRVSEAHIRRILSKKTG